MFQEGAEGDRHASDHQGQDSDGGEEHLHAVEDEHDEVGVRLHEQLVVGVGAACAAGRGGSAAQRAMRQVSGARELGVAPADGAVIRLQSIIALLTVLYW